MIEKGFVLTFSIRSTFVCSIFGEPHIDNREFQMSYLGDRIVSLFYLDLGFFDATRVSLDVFAAGLCK